MPKILKKVNYLKKKLLALKKERREKSKDYFTLGAIRVINTKARSKIISTEYAKDSNKSDSSEDKTT